MNQTNAIVQRFSSHGCARLLERLRQRLARGAPLSGTIVMSDLSADEQTDIAALLGRRPGHGRTLTVSLEQIDTSLRAVGLNDGLRGVVEAVLGPIENRHEVTAKEQAAWLALWADAHTWAGEHASLIGWIEDLRSSGLLVRLSRRDVGVARDLLTTARLIVERLPARGERLTSLAAAIDGDSHALDAGNPLATLVLRFEAQLGTSALDSEDEEQTRRSRWAALGVALDELSAPALVLGLAPVGNGVGAQLLRIATSAGEPCLIPLRLLLREVVIGNGALTGASVFICENPTIVSLAADRLGARCPPLICTQGMPGAATQVLLRQLARSGSVLRYHGDFDWPGVCIARWVMAQTGAQPWRFDATNYLAAPPGPGLQGAAQATPWDPHLSDAMERRGRVVHEEALSDILLGDLYALSTG